MNLLSKYVSDLKNDGTYTLDLDEAETKELWDEIDVLEARILKLEEIEDYWYESDFFE
jgi:hypothetical protein